MAGAGTSRRTPSAGGSSSQLRPLSARSCKGAMCNLGAIRNQQVSGSSPLAGSIKINNLQRHIIRLVWAESALSQQSHRAVSRQVFAQLA